MSVSRDEFNLDAYIKELKATPNDYTTIIDLLKHLRQTKLRKSEIVVTYGPKLISKYSSRIQQNEFWDIIEQVFIAALDVGDEKLAKNQFGEGTRAKRLLGLHLEFKGEWSAADKLYASILAKEPANMIVMKRQICIRKAMGDAPLTIKLLNDYLKLFMGDTDAWHELAELYLEQQMYQRAAFCYEELMLAFPQNHHFCTKYAEILYTMGGPNNFKMARKYYAHSLELNNVNNVRALYGILMSAIAVNSTKQGKQEKENARIFDWAYAKLSAIYKEQSPAKLSLLKSLQTLMNKESS